jgi:chemotaxis methyl-accepting protein methylase
LPISTRSDFVARAPAAAHRPGVAVGRGELDQEVGRLANGARRGLFLLRGVDALKSTTWYERLRHRVALLREDRVNSHFTGFQRLPTQYDAFVGPVVERLIQRRGSEAELAVAVHGCSNGSEAYTAASLLMATRPDVPFRVRAFDLVPEVVEHARAARYGQDEIFNNKHLRPGFLEATFDREVAGYVVKPAIRERVDFGVANVLSADLAATAGDADVVFAQNFLFHLDRVACRRALENLCTLMRPGGALFIDGVDLDLRLGFVRRHGLEPLDYEIETIHNEARWARAVGWPYHYWGLEPFNTVSKDWRTRYGTVFLAP